MGRSRGGFLVLKNWLEAQSDLISRRWRAELRPRLGRLGDKEDELLGSFLGHLVTFLPYCLAEKRETGMEIWRQAAHLYGSLALRRGLAAGEVVEELGLLREVVLKLLLEDGPGSWGTGTFQRDLLALNRCLDRALVAASVAYVDDLFFAHLQGSGVPEGVTQEVEEETRAQLKAFLAELELNDPKSL